MSSAVSGISSSTATSSSGAFGAMSSEDFINILTEQLANQDPFEPQDSSALLEQLSTLRTVESQMSLSDSIAELVLQNQVATAGGLIGKSVEGRTDDLDSVDGIVTAVTVQDGSAYLELDTGKTLPMANVTRIIQSDA
ncbi:MAG: flagellar hook assembly protein FlgD [Phycisphaeraceae bacterium JB051]